MAEAFPKQVIKFLVNENSKNICRLCFAVDENNDFVHITDNIITENDDHCVEVSLWEILNAVADDKQLAETAILPNTVCVECAKELVLMHFIMMKCQKQEKILSDATRFLANLSLDMFDTTEVLETMSKANQIRPQIAINLLQSDFDPIPQEPEPMEKSTIPKNTHSRAPKDIIVKKPFSYVCGVCKTDCGNSESLRFHIKQQHMLNRTPLSGMRKQRKFCKKCNLKFRDYEAFKSHKRDCGKQKKPSKKLVMEKPELPSTLICEKCGKIFKKRAAFAEHEESCNKPTLIIYECGQCKFVAKQRTLLLNHMKNKHGFDGKNCQLCKISFKSYIEYNKHMELHAQTPQCEVCDCVFLNQKALEAHSKSHYQHECEMCHLRFSDEAQMSQHISEVHNTMIRYECGLCNTAFSSLDAFHRHKQRHELEGTVEIVVSDNLSDLYGNPVSFNALEQIM